MGVVKTCVEEMKLVYCASDAVCKQQDISCQLLSAPAALRHNIRIIPLQPGNFLGRILKSRSGAAHSGGSVYSEFFF